MQRSLFLFLLCVVSVTFLWLQITVFNNIEPDRKYITQGKGVFGLLPDFVLRGWDDERRVAKDDLLLLVYDFNETCTRNGLTTFLIDPVILQSFLQEHVTNAAGEKAPSRCYNFCQKSCITFGVLANSWNIHVLNDLKDKGMRFIFTSGPDPRLANLTAAAAPALIPVHLFFVRNQFVIHVIVLYERGVLGLWHGAFSPEHLSSNDTFTIEERERVVALHRNFQNEGVLNRFSLRFSIVDGLSVRLPSEITVFLKDLEESRFLPCNIETAREFYSKYGDDKSEEAWSFRKRGKDVLQIAKIVLDNLEVPFWLSSGTCLGWFRQCSVISHGKDMDIGIWIKHYKKELIEEFLTNGLYLDHIFGKVEDSFQMSFRTIDDIKLDIFFFYEEGTYMWNGGTQAKSGKKFKYIFPNFSLCWTEFLGMKVRVPCETQAYIEANYGTSWAVPIKQWDWKKSPSNVIENGKWDKKDWPEVIQFFEIQ